MKNSVAVVLPALNEAAGLETLVWRIARALRDHDYEIVVVDDGSTDGTAEIADELSRELPIHVVRHGVNQGYGAAIRSGLLAAKSRADIVVTMDADDSHDPSLIPLMLYGVACGSDVIVASRFVPGGREVGVPFHRMLLSRGAAVVFGRVLSIDDVHDYTSGYRAYRSEFLDQLVDLLGEERFLLDKGFTVGVELLLKADRAGGRLAEVPLVLRYDRKQSESKLDIQQTVRDYGRLLARVRGESKLGERDETTESRAGRLGLGDGVAATAAADVVAVLASFGLSFVFYRGLVSSGLLDRGFPEFGRYAVLALLYAATTLFSFWRFGLYVPRPSALHLRHLQQAGEALMVSVALFFAVLFFTSGNHPSRLIVFGAIAASFPLVMASRRLVTGWLRQRRLEQRRVGRALIYGAGWTGRLLMKKIIEAPRLGTEVVGFLDDGLPVGHRIGHRLSQIDNEELSVSVLGGGADLARAVVDAGATELYLAAPDMTDSQIAAIRAEAEALGLDFGIVPRMGEVRVDQLEVDDLGAIPVLRMHRELPHPLYNLLKRTLDLVLIVFLAPAAIPLAAITSAVIWLEGRPILFKQIRIGKDGRPFTVVKFRTMHPDVDPYSNSPSSDRDPRITPVGRIVRMAGLDELPQLLNVLRGDMSLVGPRPEMPHIVADYTELQRQRLSVRPGISGLWQLSPNRSEAIHDNLEYDLYYLRQHKILFDLLIIGETIIFVGKAFAMSVASLFRSKSNASPGLESPAYARVATDGTAVRSRRKKADRGFVLVALDQRRRPDEPSSWRRYMPQIGNLWEECQVKVLVAEKNSGRLRELAGLESPGPATLEFVPYGDAANMQSLAASAGVTITDVQHMADLASNGTSSVLLIDDGQIRTATVGAGNTLLAERVKAAFSGPDDRLRVAN